MVSHVVCISFGCVFSTSYNFAIAIDYEYLATITCTLSQGTRKAKSIKVESHNPIGLSQYSMLKNLPIIRDASILQAKVNIGIIGRQKERAKCWHNRSNIYIYIYRLN